MPRLIDPRQGYLRTPDRFPHDAFAADTGGRVRPHTGFDASPTVPGARALSCLPGTVLRVAETIYAGRYVEIDGADGWRWLYLHLATHLTRPGTRLDEGDPLGVIGNTGGGGALKGKPVLGVHIHVSRCRDAAAVDRIINGRVRPRIKGETREQWAAAHGLSDPWPIIRDGYRPKTDTPATTPTPTLEADMYTVRDVNGGATFLVTANGLAPITTPAHANLVRRMLTRGADGKTETFNRAELDTLARIIRSAK